METIKKILLTVYLMTCKICKNRYVGSTISKLRSRFNQCKFNLNFCGFGKKVFIQESSTEHCFTRYHFGSHTDMKEQ